MNQYGCWRAIFMSFYSRHLYRDIAKNWEKRIFLYLTLIAFLFALPFAFQQLKEFNSSTLPFLNEMLAQAPGISIKDGVLRTPENHPYFIKTPDKKFTK